MFTYNQIKEAVLSLGYLWFDNGNYNLNIVGIRNSDTGNEITNKFDDWVTVSYRVEGTPYCRIFNATTDPGTHWAKNLLNPNGVAILKPGQYRSSHMIGLHQGKYEALRQKNPVKVYRDGDKDEMYDLVEEDVQNGIFGINIHRASKWGTSTQIDKWSAGCQVIANNEDFDEFMSLARKGAQLYGNSFTYTLIESNNIV